MIGSNHTAGKLARRLILSGALMAMAGTPVLAVAEATPASAASFPTSHTLGLSFLQDPGQPPDPDVYYAGEGLLLTRNMYQNLLQYKADTAKRVLEPELATSWSVSSNGLLYTLHLRHGVLFHDGTPFTSAAIAPDFARRAAVNGGPAYMVVRRRLGGHSRPLHRGDHPQDAQLSLLGLPGLARTGRPWRARPRWRPTPGRTTTRPTSRRTTSAPGPTRCPRPRSA